MCYWYEFLCTILSSMKFTQIIPGMFTQGWACGPSAFHSEFYSYMCRLVALFLIRISKPLRLLQMYIFLS